MERFSDTKCTLGEGPFWHPRRNQFFWFDILESRLYTRTNADEHHWQLKEQFSAAGWVDDETLFMPSETGFWTFDIASGRLIRIAALDAANPVTRSNDGRADPFGGFWIGTMGKNAEKRAGAIWRYYKGEVRKLFDGITVSNSICFAPDGTTAYFADTWNKRIDIVRLDDRDGWPTGDVSTFVDLKSDGLNPDGSVVDAEGNLWNAQWGAAQVTCYAPDGKVKDQIACPAQQASCPCFGGDDLRTLFVTSAAIDVDGPADGMTFFVEPGATGQAEHRVIL